MKEHEPQKIGQIVSALIQNLGFERKISETDAVRLWKDVVGEKIARQSEAIRITEGRLMVRVADPAWRQQLLYLKKELIANLNARLGKAIVKDIFLT